MHELNFEIKFCKKDGIKSTNMGASRRLRLDSLIRRILGA